MPIYSMVKMQEAKRCKLTSDKRVDLADNKLVDFETKIFIGANRLSYLKLDMNLFTCIPFLESAKNSLRELFISRNKLGKCRNDIQYSVKFTKLFRIGLVRNDLSLLPNIVFQSPRLQNLYLQENLFVTLPNLHPTSPSLTTVWFTENKGKLVCDDKLLWMKPINKGGRLHSKCFSPSKQRGKWLDKVLDKATWPRSTTTQSNRSTCFNIHQYLTL